MSEFRKISGSLPEDLVVFVKKPSQKPDHKPDEKPDGHHAKTDFFGTIRIKVTNYAEVGSPQRSDILNAFVSGGYQVLAETNEILASYQDYQVPEDSSEGIMTVEVVEEALASEEPQISVSEITRNLPENFLDLYNRLPVMEVEASEQPVLALTSTDAEEPVIVDLPEDEALVSLHLHLRKPHREDPEVK